MLSPVRPIFITPSLSEQLNKIRGSTNKSQQSIAPRDYGHFVKISMFLLGIGAMISPNALLLCADYYIKEYKNIPKLIYYIIPTYSISNTIFILIMIQWGTKLSFSLRIWQPN